MKEDDLRRVEAELGLTPPGDYRRLLLAFPFPLADRTQMIGSPRACGCSRWRHHGRRPLAGVGKDRQVEPASVM